MKSKVSEQPAVKIQLVSNSEVQSDEDDNTFWSKVTVTDSKVSVPKVMPFELDKKKGK